MNGSVGDLGRQLSELWASIVLWFQAHILQILIGVAAAVVIFLLLSAVREFGTRLCRYQGRGGGWAQVIGRAIDKTSNLFIIALAAELVSGYAQAPYLVSRTIYFLFTIATVIQVAVWVREIVLGMIERRAQVGQHEALESAVGIIRLLVSIALFAIAAIVILDNLGVNVTGLVAGLGIGGIAIGLAAQGIFADLFAALSIIFDRPFRRGDSIAYDQTSATVEAIGLKSTRLRAVTGEQRIISNKNLLDKEIRNNTRLDRRRGKFSLGLIQQIAPDRLERVPDMLRDIVRANGANFVRAGFVNFGASTLDFEVEFDVMSSSYEDFYRARHAIGIAILKRFEDEKLDLAYPSQTTFTAAPDGRLIMPYPEVQAAKSVSSTPPRNGEEDQPKAGGGGPAPEGH